MLNKLEINALNAMMIATINVACFNVQTTIVDYKVIYRVFKNYQKLETAITEKDSNDKIHLLTVN